MGFTRLVPGFPCMRRASLPSRCGASRQVPVSRPRLLQRLSTIRASASELWPRWVARLCFRSVPCSMRIWQDLDIAAAGSDDTMQESGELVCERLVQAAVELAVHVLPVGFSTLATSWLKFAAAQQAQAAERGEPVDLQAALRKELPSAAGLAQLWPTAESAVAFQRVRPQYVIGAVKASPCLGASLSGGGLSDTEARRGLVCRCCLLVALVMWSRHFRGFAHFAMHAVHSSLCE